MNSRLMHDMKRGYICFFLLLICWFKSHSQAIIVSDGSGKQIESKLLFYLDDGSKGFTPDSFLTSLPSVQPAKGVLNYDHTDDVFWTTFTLTSKSKDSSLSISILNPLLDSVDFYEEVNGKWVRSHIYMLEPFTPRPVFSNYSIFPIQIHYNQSKRLLLRIRNTEQMLLPIQVSDTKAIVSDSYFRDIVYGLFSGVILVMIFYNLFVYFSTRDKSYILYVLYILSIGLGQLTMSGHSYQFLFQQFPVFNKYAIVIFPALSGVFAVVFLRSFLQTKINTPKLDFGIRLLLYVYFLIAMFRGLGYFHLSSRMMDIAGMFGAVLVYAAAVFIYRKGFKTAGYFLIAWTTFMAGVFLFVMRNLNVLPFNDFTSYTLPVGAAFEVGLLSFALADKINTLEKQRREKEAEAYKAAIENERLIKEQNVILEQRVKERTFELSQSNESLGEALQQLKESQSQLVEQEKMASLGQLTAGIAHEINNPINFVSSNVSPLRRDVKMMLELYDEVERIALDPSSVADKMKKIEGLKEDLEFDYLKEEVETLLRGIGDGAKRTAEIVKGLKIFARTDEDVINKADIIEGINSTIVIISNMLGKIKVERKFVGSAIIDCYPGKLNQVFLNLLSNSIYAVNQKFGNNDGGLIEIGLHSDDQWLYLEFHDNGIGMTDEVKAKLFDPFFTTKPVGEGTGLGLSIVFKTIERHEGTISCVSEEGTGSTFMIKLPLVLKNS